MKDRHKGPEPHSFGFKINVGKIASNPVHATLEASDGECRELAERWGVDSVESVRADLHISRWKHDGVRIKGVVEATLTQSCVVTLEPVVSRLSEAIDAVFVPEGSKLARMDLANDGEIVVEVDAPDVPETFSGDTIDVGALCEEFIVMAIDPYPRSQGAVFQPDRSDLDEDPTTPSPFAKLKAWKEPQ